MKRFSVIAMMALMAAFIFGSFGEQAFAKDKHRGYKGNKSYVVGTVESIDSQNKTFTVVSHGGEKIIVAVSPVTEFEIERGKGSVGDFFAKFPDLRAGDWVKVKSYQTSNAGPLADDVEIYR